MSKKIELFITENKEKFDDLTPSENIWENISAELNKDANGEEENNTDKNASIPKIKFNDN